MQASATPAGTGGGLNDMPGYPQQPPLTIAVDFGAGHGVSVGFRGNVAGVDYVVTRVDGVRVELTIDTIDMVALTGAQFESLTGRGVSVGHKKRNRGKVQAPRCQRCNAINAENASRCTRCGGKVR